jgi:small-conductance mechanosensitive channel
MTNQTTNAAANNPDLQAQASSLIHDTTVWLAGNTVNIALAVAAGVAIALALLGIRMLGCRLIERQKGTDLHWRVIFARVIARTRFFFIVLASAELVAEHAATPPSLLGIIHVLFVIAAALQAAIWARELVLGYVEHRVGPDAEHSSLGSAIGIIRLLVSIALFSIAIILILDNLGINVTGLVAGLGIGGIAIGLAAKGIFDDLFSALSIIFDKPFRRGDSIRWDETSGTVENIGLKTTRVRATTGEEVVISNTNLLNKEIHNLARLHRRRVVQQFGLVYQTPPEVCARIPDIVREVLKGCEKCTLIRCGMIGYGASSLDFEFQFDVASEAWQKVFDSRSQVLIALLERFNAEKIEFAYPTQTSFTAAPDGTLILPYPSEGETSSNTTETR